MPEGLEPEQVREIIKTSLDLNKLVSLDVVEFNKSLGNPDNSLLAVKRVFEPDTIDESSEESSSYQERAAKRV